MSNNILIYQIISTYVKKNNNLFDFKFVQMWESCLRLYIFLNKY